MNRAERFQLRLQRANRLRIVAMMFFAQGRAEDATRATRVANGYVARVVRGLP